MLKDPGAAGGLYGNEAGPGEKLVERSVSGHPSAKARRPTPRDLTRGEHQLAAGLAGVGVERGA